MRAWQVAGTGEPRDALTFVDIPRPDPGPGQVLVRVRAAALNFIDVLLCRGRYQEQPELPFTPGVELCGDVAALGAEVGGVAPGERLIGMAALPAGGLAEDALLTGAHAYPAPTALDDAEAGAFHIGYQTAWFALHRRAGLRREETLLVHGAAGGVGSAAVQVGKAAGARVIAVVGGPAKAAAAAELGADVVVDRHREDFVAIVQEATGGAGADVVYDPVGGDTYRRSTKCVAFEGRIVLIGFAGGEIQSAALNHALIKNYAVVGLHWGRYRERDPAAVAACHQELARLAGRGLRPPVTERVALEGVPEALQRLADGATIGRVVHVAP